MADNVPQLVDKKGGAYTASAPRLEAGKFNKWKKRMLCYLTGMEPYYITLITVGPFVPMTAEGLAKPDAQWTPDERRVVNQDQRLKSIIISCLPDDVMESVINCATAKQTWDDLVHSFEGPSDTKENRVMDLKLEYNTFRAKDSESLSETYTRYKTLINELSNDGVVLTKHEINVGFVNSLPEKWLNFSQGLRNANNIQNLELPQIYGKFVYEDNLISRRYPDSKKAQDNKKALTISPISTAFYSNGIVQDFQETSDDEADVRSSEEYLRDLQTEFQERALLANSKRFIKRNQSNFQKAEANETTECYKCGKRGHFAKDCFSKTTSEPSYKFSGNTSSSGTSKFQPKMLQSTQHFQNNHIDYEAKYRKAKAKLALLETTPLVPQATTSKPAQPKNKVLVAEAFDWDEEDVSSDEEEVKVSALMALAEDDKLAVGKNHARNGEWVNITMRKVNILLSMDDNSDWQSYINYINVDLKYVEEQRLNLFSKYNKIVFELNKCRDELLTLKQAKLEAVTLQIQNSEILKQNQALQAELKKEKAVIASWTEKNPKVFDTVSLIPTSKRRILGEDQLTEQSSEYLKETAFVSAGILSKDELKPKPSDWVERFNPDSKLPNFDTGRILQPESQAIKELLGVTDEPSTTESVNESESPSPLPPLKTLQGAAPSSDLKPMVFSQHSPREKSLGLVKTILKRPTTEVSVDDSSPSVHTEKSSESTESKIDQLAELLRKLEKKIESSDKISKPKAKDPKPASSKPTLKCELCNYTNHHTDDCYRILFCMICKMEDHRTSDHLSYTVSCGNKFKHKAHASKHASGSKSSKAKPLPPCTYCGFNDHRSNDCLLNTCCDICGDPNHETARHDTIIQARRGKTKITSQSAESSSSTKCQTCGSSVHTTTEHGSLTMFKKAIKAKPTPRRANKKN